MVKYHALQSVSMKTHSTDWVQELDIADGLKQLLIDSDFTIESVIGLGYREVSEMLHIDPYVGKLIVEAAQSVMQGKDNGQDLMNNIIRPKSQILSKNLMLR
jgi:hypothetical protein